MFEFEINMTILDVACVLRRLDEMPQQHKEARAKVALALELLKQADREVAEADEGERQAEKVLASVSNPTAPRSMCRQEHEPNEVASCEN